MEKKTKTIPKGIVCLGIIFIILFAIFYLMSDRFGMTTLSIDGKQIYFKRRVRGMNYDRIILSSNSNYCAGYNPDTDFNFPSLDDVIYYKIDGKVFQLISSPTVQPKSFPVKVEVYEPENTMEWISLENTHKEKKLERLDVPLSNSMWCF